MSYVVHGATGAQGSPVVSALLATGAPVAAITRDQELSLGGAETVVADLSSAESLIRAYRNAEGVFVHLPAAPEQTLRPMVGNIVAAMQATTPARVVVSTSGMMVSPPQHPTTQAREDSAVAALISGITALGLPCAVIEPRLFLENLLMPPITAAVRSEGVLRYPVREDLPISWASHRDIADAAVSLLLARTEIAGVVGVGQLPGVTGRDLVAAYAAHTGQEVRFQAVTPADFGAAIAAVVGNAAAAGVVGLYQSLWETDNHLIDEPTSAQHLLGLIPRSTGQWLSEIGF